MSTAAILTYGFGTFGGVHRVPVHGFALVPVSVYARRYDVAGIFDKSATARGVFDMAAACQGVFDKNISIPISVDGE